MSAHLIPLYDRAGWEAALEGVPHAFWHTWESCQAMTTPGLRTFLYVLEYHGIRVVCPIVERPAGEEVDVVTSYGFSGFVGTGECPTLPARWHEFARDAGYVCGYVVVHPALTGSSYFADTAVFHRSVFVFDLRLDEEALFARSSTNRRREVRRADKEGLLSTEQDGFADFFVET